MRPASIRAIQTSAHNCEKTRGLSNSGNTNPPPTSKPTVDIPSPAGGGVGVGARREDSMSSLGSSATSAGWSPRNGSPPPGGDATPRARTTTPSLQLSRHISAGSADTQGSGASGESSAGKFDPAWYLSLLGEGTAAVSHFCQSDRDLQKSLSEIKAMLLNKDDWEMRFTALGKVQGLVGDLPSCGVSPDAIAAAIRATILEEVGTASSSCRSLQTVHIVMS